MNFREKIQRLLAAPDYHPLRRAEIAHRLRLSGSEQREFRRVLTEMLEKGEVVRVRKEQFVLPREADLMVGRIQFHEKGFAFVVPETSGADLYIAEEDTGVAMHGDKVVARQNRERRADKPSGRVIRILERAHETVVGTLQKTQRFHFIVPDEPRLIRDIYTHPAQNAKVGDKVVVKLAEWTSRHVNPEGEIVEVLGKADAPGVDVLAIIRQHKLPTRFPDAVLRETERIREEIPTDRMDLRNEFIVTIDPDDAKDFDDAVNVDELPGGGWRLGVHIADVSHYVRPGSALDREARARGNSVYLVDRVIPMLPEKLSNGLCSLRPQEDRLTQSCFIEFTSKLVTRKVEFAPSVIRSRHRLTYQEALSRLESKRNPDELTVALKKMWRLASQLRAQRFAHGSLDLDFPEVKVRLDERGRPTHIEKQVNDISHQLIEEFMLAANEAVARQISGRQVPCVYRIHEDPDLDKLREFRVYAQGFGYKVGDVAHRSELQKLLVAVDGQPEEYAIHLALLRSLKRARYSVTPMGHYGLAKKYYTHFTSPIRRYADLVVHRTLTGQVSSVTELTQIAEHVSQTERVADEAEKASVELKKLEYFQKQLMGGHLDTMEAVVCGVRNFGIFVELPESLVQGLVHISRLDDDYYHYEEQRERLVGKRTRRIIKIGDKLHVQVERVDACKKQIDFRLTAN